MKARSKWLLTGFIIFILLGTAALVILKEWQKSPSASLYYLGKAIYSRDPDLFLQYVDISAIMDNARSSWNFAPLSRLGGLDGNAAEIISQFVSNPDRPNLPWSMSILLNSAMSRPEHDQVEVALFDFWLRSEARIGFTLRQYPDQVWRVTSLNGQEVERLLLYCLGLAPP
jgi:hypothetical protein